MFRRPGDIPTVGIVGGPGAGKSVIWEALKANSNIVLVPEAPTLLQAYGLWYPSADPEFEIDVDDMRWILERQSARAARAKGARLLVTDRIVGEGRMVYCHDQTIVSATPVAELLGSYFALLVVDLPLADVWSVNRHNNPTRTESDYAKARSVHARLLDYVDSHPRKYFVNNYADGAAKVANGVRIIEQLLAEIESSRLQS